MQARTAIARRGKSGSPRRKRLIEGGLTLRACVPPSQGPALAVEAPQRDSSGMAVLPSGTVTTLFSDIAGSTLLLRKLGAEGYREQLELHRELLRTAFERHG